MNPLSLAVFCLMLLAGLLAGAGRAGAEPEEPTEAEWDVIQAVITSQIEAFKRDDATTAFSFAAPSIQKQFHTPGEFMHMVRTGYSAVYRPGSLRFLDHFVVSGQVVQPLEIVTSNDEVVVAFYIMERQPDGTWRIAGCKLEGSAAISA
jgi:hypothetical protein